MAHLRIAAAAVAELSGGLRAVAGDLAAGVRVVRGRFAALDWDDLQAGLAHDDLFAALETLEHLSARLWAQAQWLAALAARVHEEAGVAPVPRSDLGRAAVSERWRASGPSAPAPGARERAGSATVPRDAFARLSALPAVPAMPGGRAHRLLDPTQFDPHDFDWLTDDPARDLARPHHGRSPADYLAIVRAVQPVLGRIQFGGAVAPADQVVFEAFFGLEPVRLERGRDGLIAITDGRHRLWAALSAGVPIPVVAVSGP